MSDLESHDLWYRVAPLRAKLRDHVRVHRHLYRGEVWYVLQDGASSRYHRFGPGAHQLLSRLDGERTVGEVWETLDARLGEEAPSKDAVIKLLSSLHASDLLQCDSGVDPRPLFARHDRARRSRWAQRLQSPLFIRVPLFDPDRLLERWAPFARWLIGPLGLALWAAAIVPAAVYAGLYWPEIQAYWSSRALAPYNLLLLCLVYPVVKGLHELAHGLAAKRWAGEVHETGIMFLLFMPLPYVDASAACAFADKRQRMLVGAAGIMAELLLAALALGLWFNVETGMVRDLAFDVMLIGGISTVLFNGNPLLRFDGYYVLADAIEIPNLAQRSGQYYRYLGARYLLGDQAAHSPISAAGERGWFLVYGLASPLYRVFILTVVVLFVAGQHLVAGAVVAVLMLGGQVLYPLAKHLARVLATSARHGRRARALALLGLLGTGTSVLLFFVPVPSVTHAQGIVWLPEHAEVRAGADGFVIEALARTDAPVRLGEALFAIEDPLAVARVHTLEWQLREAEARHHAAFLGDRAGAAILKAEVERAAHDLEQARQDAAELTVRSPASGTLIVPQGSQLPGRFVRKGDVLGYVTEQTTPAVRVAVPQGDAGLVREGTRAVHLRLADRMAQTWEGRIEREVPSATTRLPSKALGTAGGGLLAVDPEDREGLTALEEVFLFDVALTGEAPALRPGTRAHLRFEHDAAPIAQQCYRALRQLFLRRFAV